MENQFKPYSVCDENGALVTVGFDAGVQPRPDWAPEGFGLWYMPIREQVRYGDSSSITAGRWPALEECRLVYPLDIENQRVALLERSSDGAYILLVTVEEAHYVLRVLDSTDYHLVQTLELDGAEAYGGNTSRDYVSETSTAPTVPRRRAPGTSIPRRAIPRTASAGSWWRSGPIRRSPCGRGRTSWR